MDIIAIITVIGIALANIGTAIAMFMWSTSQAALATQSHREETNLILKSIQDEIKDFHVRLIKIEEARK
jgi:hypothetical protein